MSHDALRNSLEDLIFDINEIMKEADRGEPAPPGYWIGVRRVAKLVEGKIEMLSDLGVHFDNKLRRVDDWFAGKV